MNLSAIVRLETGFEIWSGSLPGVPRLQERIRLDELLDTWTVKKVEWDVSGRYITVFVRRPRSSLAQLKRNLGLLD
jgi:hypothetical protein